MTVDYDAALRAARTFVREAAFQHFEESREDIYPAGHLAAECQMMNEALDAYEALARAVGAFRAIDGMPCPATHAYVCVRAERMKAEADRLAAPYLEEVKA